MKLQIEKAIYGGAGLARADGKAIFVPFTLPGEVVEAHVTKTSAASPTPIWTLYLSHHLSGPIRPASTLGCVADANINTPPMRSRLK